MFTVDGKAISSQKSKLLFYILQNYNKSVCHKWELMQVFIVVIPYLKLVKRNNNESATAPGM